MNGAQAPSVAWYAARFDQFEKTLNGASKTALHALRREGLARFSSAGFPTTSEEEWRFTNVAPIARIRFVPALTYRTDGVGPQEVAGLAVEGALRLVFVNGHFSRDLSVITDLPRGVKAGSLASLVAGDPTLVERHIGRQVRCDENGFTALGTAFLQDGGCVMLEDGVVLDEPVQLLFIGTGRNEPTLGNPRTLIVAGKDARLEIIETYAGVGGDEYWTNAVTEAWLGDGATVEHDKIQIESSTAFHTATTHFRLGAGATLTSNSIALGGALVRNTVTAVLEGRHGECTLNGLSLTTGTQHIDNHTAIDHASSECASHELYKTILDGKSRGVFNGKIYVRKDAQKTDAKQTNKTLLLSDDATMNTKPQLEIFADDVKCTHGATVGQLDEDQVFYLRSRGIDESAARDLLTFAFASDVIQRVHVDALHAPVAAMVHDRLHQGRGAGGR
ncbi:MAG: Fe-S cluster assembly protein SufD [Bacteroidota bacterium]